MNIFLPEDIIAIIFEYDGRWKKDIKTHQWISIFHPEDVRYIMLFKQMQNKYLKHKYEIYTSMLFHPEIDESIYAYNINVTLQIHQTKWLHIKKKIKFEKNNCKKTFAISIKTLAYCNDNDTHYLYNFTHDPFSEWEASNDNIYIY